MCDGSRHTFCYNMPDVDLFSQGHQPPKYNRLPFVTRQQSVRPLGLLFIYVNDMVDDITLDTRLVPDDTSIGLFEIVLDPAESNVGLVKLNAYLGHTGYLSCLRGTPRPTDYLPKDVSRTTIC